MSNYTIKVLSPALLSSSSDRVRSTLGGYYSHTTDPDSSENEYYDFVASSNDTDTDSTTGASCTKYSDNYIQKSMINHDKIVTSSMNNFLPSYTVPIILAGNPGSNIPYGVQDDLHWKAIIKGGTYGTSSFSGIVTTATFDMLFMENEIPYDLYALKNILSQSSESPTNYSYLTTGYKYNYSYEKYENFIENLNPLYIPNYYLLNAASLNKLSGLDSNLIKFINLNTGVEDNSYKLGKLFLADTSKTYPAEMAPTIVSNQGTGYVDQQLNYKQYIDLYVSGTILPNTFNFLKTNSKQVIIDKQFLTDANEINLDSVPFYSFLEIPRNSKNAAPNSSIGSIIEGNNLENTFMKMIKQEFVDSSQNVLKKTTSVENMFLSSSDNNLSTAHRITPNTELTYFDLLPKMVNTLQTLDSSNNNMILLSNDMIENKILTKPNETYRYIENQRIMNFLNDSVSFLNNNYSLKNTLEKGDNTLSTILDMANTANNTEVLGYRVAKVNLGRFNRPSEPSFVMNYYIFDSDDLGDSFTLYDTQVKHGYTYQYSTYKYVAVTGYRYRYHNHSLTKKISTTDDAGIEKNCLEFYKSDTNRPVDTNFEEFGDFYISLSGSGINSVSSPAQVLSEERYLCQMDMTIEPYIRVFEIPMTIKDVTVLDHPPRKVDVIPYQRKDDSQIIGFYAKYESFVDSMYPSTIAPIENKLKQTYLSSNNLTPSDFLTNPSTKPIAVEIYRIDKKPQSYSDFDNNLIMTKELSIKDYNFPFTSCFYEEKVATNKKYYYVFRFINKYLMPGQLSPVIEVELVNDGGYKYSLFDIMPASQITDKSPVDAVSKPFKKLFQLIPSPAQVILDDSAVDYSDFAANQIDNFVVGSAKTKIWDQTFKIRLTSKKTGRKLDINVTYEVKREQ